MTGMDFMVMKWEENPGKGRCVARLECFQSFWMLAFNLINLLFISSNLWTRVRINCVWNFFWITRLNFSMISVVIFMTTTCGELARALVFLGRLLIKETSPKIDPAFSSAMVISSGSWREVCPSWTGAKVDLVIRMDPVRTTNRADPLSPSAMMVSPSLYFSKIPEVFTSLDFSSSENYQKTAS